MVWLERLNWLTWRGVSLNKRRRKEKRIWKDHNLIILLFWIDGNSQAVECHHRSSSTFLITRGKLSYFYLFIFLLLFMIWIKTKKSAWSGTARTRLHAHANVISTENCCLIASLFFSLLFFCCCCSCYASTRLAYIWRSQHQQQVASAVERAKQVTMTELNAVIGVNIDGVP